MDNCYRDDKFIFGPALNNAYNLENKVVVFPRIIVDSKLREDATKEGVISFLERGEDGSYFIDYLSAGYTYAGKSGFLGIDFASPPLFFKAHKESIERA